MNVDVSEAPSQRFAERYAAGDVPWDHEDPPPEVMALPGALPAGAALDLGCGYGRAAIYLARHGWEVDGVDFVELAVEGARARAADAGVADRTRFFAGSVTDLDPLPLRSDYDLVLDIGCLHRFDDAALRAHCSGVLRRLRPGGLFLLFAHLHDPEAEVVGDDDRQWLHEEVMLDIFGTALDLERVERGTTQVRDKPPWPSAWYWFLLPTDV